MNIIMLGLVVAVVLLALGVLIGSGLHGRVVDRKYRQLAHLVRDINGEHNVGSRAGYPRENHYRRPLDLHR